MRQALLGLRQTESGGSRRGWPQGVGRTLPASPALDQPAAHGPLQALGQAFHAHLLPGQFLQRPPLQPFCQLFQPLAMGLQLPRR